MKPRAIQVPAALLLDPALTPASKLVWVAATMGPGAPQRLADRVALTRQTVQAGLARLAAAGWSPTGQAPAQARARQTSLPLYLLENRHIGAQAKVLYAALQLNPEPGRFTYTTLSTMTHTSVRTLKAAFTQLAEAGWLQFDQRNKHAPVTYNLTMPQKPIALILAERRYQRATYKGEALMREFLTLLIDRDDYADDDAPDFLKNPLTRQPLELDRFYRPDVAFEYNGPQHYRKTNLYTEQQARIQRARDFIKAGLCTDNHVTLVVIHVDDLTLERMQQKIPRHLPRRDLTGLDEAIDYLNRTAAEHRERAAN